MNKNLNWYKISQSKIDRKELLKTANGYGRFSGDLSDILEAQVMIYDRTGKTSQEIFNIIKGMISKDFSLAEMVREEGMTDEELLELIEGSLMLNKIINKNRK